MIDQGFMSEALAEAEAAAARGEVPVGAVIVRRSQVIARAGNQVEALADVTAHAELLAIRAAAEHLNNPRLADCDLYVTLEPCAMCAGAMVHARLRRVIYGARDEKTGADGSVFDLLRSEHHNHRIEVTRDVLEEDCRSLLKEFFKRRRAERRAQRGD